MNSTYHGCDKHNHPETGSNFDPSCPDCWDAMGDQQVDNMMDHINDNRMDHIHDEETLQ